MKNAIACINADIISDFRIMKNICQWNTKNFAFDFSNFSNIKIEVF